MANKKLQEIGSRLGISQKDVAAIRKERIKSTLRHPLIGAIIVLVSSLIGLLVGAANPAESGGYPYAAPGLGLMAGSKTRKGAFILVVIGLSVVGAMAAYKTGQRHAPVIEYNVFSRRK